MIIGVAAFIIEYISFLLIMMFMPGPQSIIVGQTISFLAGLLVSFFGNRKITFNNEFNKYIYGKKGQALRYLTLALFNILLTNILIYILVNLIEIMPAYAKLIVMALVISWNFIIFRKFIFKTH